MPSSSARCSHLPRAADKVPFYVGLKKLRDHLCGYLPDLQESEVCFPDLELKVQPRIKVAESQVKVELQDHNAFKANGHYGSVNGVSNVSNTVHSSSASNVASSSGAIAYPPSTNMGLQVFPTHPAVSTSSAMAKPNAMQRPFPVSTAFQSPVNAQVASQQGCVVSSNSQSQRQPVSSRNQGETFTHPSEPRVVTSSASNAFADSTAHIPCTSSAVLTSEWINKHFNNPVQQPSYHDNGLWTAHPEHAAAGKTLWHLGNGHGQGYMKHELPSDGYGSVPPSR